MKPTVPEIGTILRLEGEQATVILQGGRSCKGCGAGKIGLCRASGSSMLLNVINRAGGKPGDKVQIGIDRSVRIKGYLLAYIAPLLSFIAGALFGHVAGNYFGISSLDVITGFAALGVMSWFTFKMLGRLDRTYMLVLNKVASDNIFREEVKSDEERRYEDYALNSETRTGILNLR